MTNQVYKREGKNVPISFYTIQWQEQIADTTLNTSSYDVLKVPATMEKFTPLL
jgi:hypothetical protein